MPNHSVKFHKDLIGKTKNKINAKVFGLKDQQHHLYNIDLTKHASLAKIMQNLPHPSMPRTGLRQFGCHICHSQVWKYVIENMCAKFPCYNMTKFSANQSPAVH